MVIATQQDLAQITLKRKLPHQRDVPKKLAQQLKSSRLMVHAKPVQIIRSHLLMVKHVWFMVALETNSIPQMVCAMIKHAQNTTNQMIPLLQNVLRRHMHVLVMQIKQR